MSTAASPQPLKQVSLDLRGLYRNSPISFLGILLVGIANGAYGTLGAVFGRQAGLTDSNVALMMSTTIFAGAVMQFPAGRLSDRIDRRYVLAALAAVAAFAGLLIFLIEPTGVIISDRLGRHLWRDRQRALSDRRVACQRLRDTRGFRQDFRRPAAALRYRHDHRPDASAARS